MEGESAGDSTPKGPSTCYDVPEAPVFRPTAKEFQHPARSPLPSALNLPCLLGSRRY